MTLQNVQTETDGTARYRQTTVLDGVNFVLYFDYNARDEHWRLTVHDVEDLPIAGCVGKKLVVGWPVLHGVTDPRRPAGELLVVGPGDADPGLFNLGSDYILHYIPEGDL
jgi:hypothetical protein